MSVDTAVMPAYHSLIQTDSNMAIRDRLQMVTPTSSDHVMIVSFIVVFMWLISSGVMTTGIA